MNSPTPSERVSSLEFIRTYLLLRLDHNVGKFVPESVSVTTPGDMGLGFYSNIDHARQQQVICALKGMKTHIYTLDFPV